MLLLSTLWLHPAQLILTLVVQYHVLHASVSEVEHGDPDGHVLVLVLYPFTQALQKLQVLHALSAAELQTQGV
jgi:hypothetical protein